VGVFFLNTVYLITHTVRCIGPEFFPEVHLQYTLSADSHSTFL